MNSNSNDLRQLIQELISRSANDQLQNLRRFEELLRRAARGDINGTELREEYLRFAREEGTRYINDLTRVGLSFYHSLIELNRHYNERFFQHVNEITENQNGGSTEMESKKMRIVNMDVHGLVGEDARRAFVIENQREEVVSVSFLISEFMEEGGDGDHGFRPPLRLTPARFELNPGEERQVQISIPLLKEFFEPGKVYTATLIASGFEGLQLRIRAWADIPQEADQQDDREDRSKAFQPIFRPVEEEPDDE